MLYKMADSSIDWLINWMIDEMEWIGLCTVITCSVFQEDVNEYSKKNGDHLQARLDLSGFRTISDLEFGNYLGKGSNAAVYEARMKESRSTGKLFSPFFPPVFLQWHFLAAMRIWFSPSFFRPFRLQLRPRDTIWPWRFSSTTLCIPVPMKSVACLPASSSRHVSATPTSLTSSGASWTTCRVCRSRRPPFLKHSHSVFIRRDWEEIAPCLCWWISTPVHWETISWSGQGTIYAKDWRFLRSCWRVWWSWARKTSSIEIWRAITSYWSKKVNVQFVFHFCFYYTLPRLFN